MPEDLKLSQIGSSQLPPPFRGLHSPGVRKHCQIIFACYFRKSSIRGVSSNTRCVGYFACRSELSNLAQACLHIDLKKKGEKEGEKTEVKSVRKTVDLWAFCRRNCCLTSTGTIRTIRAATSIFTQFLISDLAKSERSLDSVQSLKKNLINNSIMSYITLRWERIGKEIDKLGEKAGI